MPTGCAGTSSPGACPGTRLPSERELSLALGVNRLTLRASLARLEALGLITTRHGAGTVVASWKERAGLEMLGTLVKGLKVADPAWHELVRSALELRRILAAEAIALAAERHTDEDIDAIAAAIQVLREHVDDPLAFARADLAFMRAVCKAARNVGLELFLNTFARWPDEYPHLVTTLYDDSARLAHALRPGRHRRHPRPGRRGRAHDRPPRAGAARHEMVAASPGAAARRRRGRRRPALTDRAQEGKEAMKLARFEDRWADAAMGAIFPGSSEAGLSDIRGMDVSGFLREVMRCVPFQAAFGLRAAVWLVALAPLFVLGRLATIAGLAVPERERVIQVLATSRSYVVRSLVMILKTMGALLYAGDGAVRARMAKPSAPAQGLVALRTKRVQAA